MPQLPLSKVKRIAKFDPDVSLVSTEAVYALTVACETFVQFFSKELHSRAVAGKRKTIQMKDVDACIEQIPWLEFLDGALTGWPEGKATDQEDDTEATEQDTEENESESPEAEEKMDESPAAENDKTPEVVSETVEIL